MAIHPERILHHYEETLEAKAEEKSANSFLGFLERRFSALPAWLPVR